jgi:hypothetical protein
MSSWGLTEEEAELAEYVYYETKGSIYVDTNGDLRDIDGSPGERVDSLDCYAFDIFIGEIENAKIRADRGVNQ